MHPSFQLSKIQRYELYIPKVENLFLESRAVIALPPPFQPTWEELWEDIANLRPVSELLSNLQRLRISNMNERLLVPLVGISGSNLTQITI
jgi:hypothetical protein